MTDCSLPLLSFVCPYGLALHLQRFCSDNEELAPALCFSFLPSVRTPVWSCIGFAPTLKELFSLVDSNCRTATSDQPPRRGNEAHLRQPVPLLHPGLGVPDVSRDTPHPHRRHVSGLLPRSRSWRWFILPRRERILCREPKLLRVIRVYPNHKRTRFEMTHKRCALQSEALGFLFCGAHLPFPFPRDRTYKRRLL